MSNRVTEVVTETAYDAMQDGLALVVRLASSPASFEELCRLEPELAPEQIRRRLDRLVRSGLVRRQGDRFEAVARMVQQARQEGMVTSLSRYVLPLFTDLVREPGKGFVTQIDLQLSLEEQQGLRTGPVQQLIDRLNDLSDEPAEARRPCITVVVGTSDVPPNADPGDRLLETVRRSARQRATSGAADRAVLTQFDAYFGLDVICRAEALVRELADEFAARKKDGARANYTLALAFGAREGAENAR